MITRRDIRSFGLTDRYDLGRLLQQYELLCGAEIGVLEGEFSSNLRRHYYGTLYLVDAWKHLDNYIDVENVEQGKMDQRHLMVQRMFLGDLSTRIIRAMSVEAATIFEPNSLDWVYIDADHSAPGVQADLDAWVPKVRTGGLICGHDYIDSKIAGPDGKWIDFMEVKSIVDAYAAARGVRVVILDPASEYASWCIIKTW